MQQAQTVSFLYTGLALEDFGPDYVQYTEQPQNLLSFKKDDRVCIVREGKHFPQGQWLFGFVQGSVPQQNGWFPGSFICQEERQQRYFGVPLTDLCRRENRVVPRVVEVLGAHIRANCQKEGIFRMPGNNQFVQQAYEEINQGNISSIEPGSTLCSLSSMQTAQTLPAGIGSAVSPVISPKTQQPITLDTYEIAQLFKQFYKELPSRLVKNFMVPQLQKALETGSAAAVADVLLQLDSPEELINLRYLLQTLDICARSRSQSKMGAENIALLLSGWVVETEGTAGADSSRLLQQMIEQWPQIETELISTIDVLQPDLQPDLLPWRKIVGQLAFTCKPVTNDFRSQIAKCLAVRAGDVVQIERRQNGWYYCSKDGMHGWLPVSAFK